MKEIKITATIRHEAEENFFSYGSALYMCGYDLGPDHRIGYEFEVPDNELGISTVARALGYGMSLYKPTSNAAKELGASINSEGKMDCTYPNLFMSPDTCYYKEVWGGVRAAFDSSIPIWNGNDEPLWTTDVYRLRTNLENGGAMVESYSSSASITTEKRGNRWILTLNLPIVSHDEKVGAYYQERFHDAYQWYQHQVSR